MPIIWLTGLSGAGKSTLAARLASDLRNFGVPSVVLDGDALRTGLSQDLRFSDSDRGENVRRAVEAGILICQSGVVAIVAMISPFRNDRLMARDRCSKAGVRFSEIFINAPLAVCELRDPKQLYRRARNNEIQAFTGVTSPYEPPTDPDLEISTGTQTLCDSGDRLFSHVRLLIDDRADG